MKAVEERAREDRRDDRVSEAGDTNSNLCVAVIGKGQAGSISEKTPRRASNRRSSLGSKRSLQSSSTPGSHDSAQSRFKSARSSASSGGMNLLCIDDSVIADVPPEQWKSRTREAEDNLRRLQEQRRRRQQQRAAVPPKPQPVAPDMSSPLSTLSSDSAWARALQQQVDRKRRLTLAEREKAMAELRSQAMANSEDRKARMEARLVALPHHFRKNLLFTAMRRYVAIERTARDRGECG